MFSDKSGPDGPKPQQGIVLNLLGRPSLFHNGEDLTGQIKYRKGIALLGYLAANAGTWFSRERLADLFWPSLETGAARTNLRQVLNNLSTLLNGAECQLLQKDGSTVAFIPSAGIRLDISLLSDTVVDRIATGGPDTQLWRQREIEPWTSVLGGEFLANLQLPDTPEFDEWLEAKRMHFSTRAALLLEYICRAQFSERRLAEAVVCARQLTALTPFDDQGNFLLISILAEAGDIPAALEAFGVMQKRLCEEVGVAPSARLVALRDDLLQRINQREVKSLTSPDVGSAEKRYVAALYCAFDEMHDEDESLFEKVDAIVCQRGGVVASSVGRGVLAVFGVAGSAERATQRAALAAQEMLSPNSPVAAFAPRIGLCAGPVILRSVDNMPSFSGEIPDLAKLIGWGAEAGEILASEVAAQLAGELFSFELVSEHSFHGFRDKHRLYRLTGLAGTNNSTATPLIGRENEMSLLRACWKQAAESQERIAVLYAPPGMGKTRLAGELGNWVESQGGRVRRIQCRLEHQYQPLAAVLAEIGDQLKDATDGPQSKSEIFEAVIAQLVRETKQLPTLLWVDDLHWADLTTRELLALLVRRLESKKVLLVVTTRPGVVVDYPSRITQTFELAPLSQAASLAMIAAYDRDNSISERERADLAATCAGIPLFIERLVRGHLEGGLHRLSITKTLQGELDSLGGDRRVLHAAAVLGERFERRHLASLVPDADIVSALARAAGLNLVSSLSDGTCAFCHALIRDAAYESLTSSRRRLLHERIARIFANDPEISAEEIALHYSAAECRHEAVEWWIKAGDQAMQREFAADAMASYQKALDQFNGAIAEEALVRSIRMRLGYAAHVAEGYGSSLTYRLFAEMAAEIEGLKDYDSGELFSALAGCYMGGSSFARDEGLKIATRLHELAHTDSERLMAFFALGNTLFWLGDFNAAEEWQRKCMALGEIVSFKERIRYGVDDPIVTSCAFNGWTLWFLGKDELACTKADEAITLARKGKRAHTLCFALVFAACLHWYRNDVSKVAELASEALSLAKEFGFPLWEGGASLLLLWAQAASGEMAETGGLFGAALMLQQALPSRVTTSRWIVIYALLEMNEWGEAEKLVDIALREVEFLEEQYCVGDLLRIKAKCLEKRALFAEAQEFYSQGLALAKQQGAKGLISRLLSAS